jgi:antitoxin component YwqK of YwqJK toxin-antitoxin module
MSFTTESDEFIFTLNKFGDESDVNGKAIIIKISDAYTGEEIASTQDIGEDEIYQVGDVVNFLEIVKLHYNQNGMASCKFTEYRDITRKIIFDPDCKEKDVTLPYESGILKYTCSDENSLEHEMNKNRVESYYRNGLLDGLYMVYSEDNSMIEMGNYINGLKNGTLTSYYDNGNIRVKCSYTNGKLEGLYESWFKNGKKEISVNYDNGMEHGLYHSWYECGKFSEVIEYRYGVMNGRYQSWYDNGKPMVVCSYLNGDYHGDYASWDETGTEHDEKKYVYGKLHGTYKLTRNGEQYITCHYIDGYLHGSYKKKGESIKMYERGVESRIHKSCETWFKIYALD